jgi:hypothetical protein
MASHDSTSNVMVLPSSVLTNICIALACTAIISAAIVSSSTQLMRFHAFPICSCSQLSEAILLAFVSIVICLWFLVENHAAKLQ